MRDRLGTGVRLEELQIADYVDIELTNAIESLSLTNAIMAGCYDSGDSSSSACCFKFGRASFQSMVPTGLLECRL